MKTQIASSRFTSRWWMGAPVGLVLSSLFAQALAPARAAALAAQSQSASVQATAASPSPAPDAIGGGCSEELAAIGRSTIDEIRRVTQTGTAAIAMLDSEDVEEISRLAHRTVQFIVFGAGRGRTEVHARLQECLDFIDRFGGPLDLRDAMGVAARASLQAIDAAVDEALDEVHRAIWTALEER